MRRLVTVLLLTTTVLSGAAGAAEKGSARNASVATPDPQIAAGNEQLRASAVRLKAAARAAEVQPGSPAARNDLKAALGDTEASLEYVIGKAARLLKGDASRDLELMMRTLDALKKEKQDIISKISAKAGSGEWQRTLQGIAALSDRALAAAVVLPSRGLDPTPRR